MGPVGRFGVSSAAGVVAGTLWCGVLPEDAMFGCGAVSGVGFERSIRKVWARGVSSPGKVGSGSRETG